MHIKLLLSVKKDLASAPRITLIAAITFLLAASPSYNAILADEAESQLESRVTAFWNAMQAEDYETAAQYVIQDARQVFLLKMPKAKIQNWKIDKLEFNATRTLCLVHVSVVRPIPATKHTIPWPLQNEWLLQDGNWFISVSMAGL